MSVPRPCPDCGGRGWRGLTLVVTHAESGKVDLWPAMCRQCAGTGAAPPETTSAHTVLPLLFRKEHT